MSTKKKAKHNETADTGTETGITLERDESVGRTVKVEDMKGLFVGDDYVIPEGIEIRSMSPLIAPAQFPANRRLVGKFTKIFETEPTKGKKGVGVEIIPIGMTSGIALPAVTTLARGLGLDDVEKGKDATSPYIGRYVMIERLPNKIPSKQGQAAWNFLVGILPADYSPVVIPAAKAIAG